MQRPDSQAYLCKYFKLLFLLSNHPKINVFCTYSIVFTRQHFHEKAQITVEISMQMNRVVYTIELQRYESLADVTKILFSNHFLTEKPSSSSKPEQLTGIQFIRAPASDMSNFAILTFCLNPLNRAWKVLHFFLLFNSICCATIRAAELSPLNDEKMQ